MAHKAKTYILPSGPALDKVCPPAFREVMDDTFDTVWNLSDEPYTTEQLAAIIGDAEIILSSWGSPRITLDMLNKAERLRYYGHAAGSVKGFVPGEIVERGVKVFSGAPRLAQSVGEYCLTVLLAMLKQLPACSEAVRRGGWWDIANQHLGQELAGQTIGIVSASSTARAFLRLLGPFGVKVLVYDPYLSEDQAQQLGVERASLEQVMHCPIISLHAPALPSTVNLIDERLIRSIPDHAILINSSRGAVLDEGALLAELQTGRFRAVLDVLQQEPPGLASPFLQLDNVLLTPHIAGNTEQCKRALMPEIVGDIVRSMRGEPTRYEVAPGTWNILA
ncbi:hydroxyacid dehydrogenase [Paenibacillus oryzisoli]|uniref:hydroxyacid dehydrogenase n=1 Tax=Paenibacillus oryzisoli TaxID=1850517 RepID=UPI003D2A3560